MRLARYNADRLGLVRNEQLIDVTEAAAAAAGGRGGPPAIGDLLIGALDIVSDRARELGKWGFVQLHANVLLRSPVAAPGRILVAPQVRSVRDSDLPGWHPGGPVAVGPGEGVRLADPEQRVSCAAGLALVVGSSIAEASRERALEAIAGYAVGLHAKPLGVGLPELSGGVASVTVLGPWLVTADEIEDPDGLCCRFRRDGDSDDAAPEVALSRDCRALVAGASRLQTLHPGDVLLACGPGPAVDASMGDTIACGISGIGEMRVAVHAG